MDAIWISSDDYETLTNGWRTKAGTFRDEAAAEGAARALERAARDLDEWFVAQKNKLLTLSEAAERSGRTSGTVGRAISNGHLTNHGKPNKPLVCAGEVAQVFPPRGTSRQGGVANKRDNKYDPATDARSLRERRGA